MAVPVLVVTPNAGFGELVGQILSETGDYILSMASNPDDALAVVGAQKPVLLVLEVNGETGFLPQFGESVRELAPELLTVLILQKELAADEGVDAFQPDGILSKPVYLPDLVSKVEEVINKSDLEELEQAEPDKVVRATVPQEAGDTNPPPEWLSDVNLAAQHLTRLSLESSAQASLITKKADIWAYAGELPQPAAEELARTVSEHFEDGGGSDLARFVKLEETGSEYMLYATGLGGDFVLATVFNAETPFSKIRAQASNLAVALSTPPAPIVEEEPVEEFSDEDLLLESEGEMELWPLLDDVPPPIPTDWVPEKTVKDGNESLLEELLEDSQQDEFSTETVAMQSAVKPAVVQEEPQPEPQPLTGETIVSKSTQRAAKQIEETTKVSPRRDFEEEDLPKPEADIDVEPVSPSMYNLTYACVLIPRFPHHHLTGESAKRLTDWITQLCIAFGWRLEQLSIRPDYMQWLVNVPPNTSPGYLMRTIREHTSRRMFVEFPVTEEDNPSGDFWAPGYLILGSPQPPPASLVQEFMQNTRSRQGLQEERPS